MYKDFVGGSLDNNTTFLEKCHKAVQPVLIKGTFSATPQVIKTNKKRFKVAPAQKLERGRKMLREIDQNIHIGVLNYHAGTRTARPLGNTSHTLFYQSYELYFWQKRLLLRSYVHLFSLACLCSKSVAFSMEDTCGVVSKFAKVSSRERR